MKAIFGPYVPFQAPSLSHATFSALTLSCAFRTFQRLSFAANHPNEPSLTNRAIAVLELIPVVGAAIGLLDFVIHSSIAITRHYLNCDKNALFEACNNGHMEDVLGLLKKAYATSPERAKKLLLSRQDVSNKSLLHLALFSPNVQPTDAVLLLCFTKENLGVDTLFTLLSSKDRQGISPFASACSLMSPEALTTLLSFVRDLSAEQKKSLLLDEKSFDGQTPFHYAAKAPEQATIPLLIALAKEVLDIEEQKKVLLQDDSCGNSPLHAYLLSQKEPPKTNHLLDFAKSILEEIELKKLLLITQDTRGNTFLHQAILNADPAQVKKFFDFADSLSSLTVEDLISLFRTPNKQGKTPANLLSSSSSLFRESVQQAFLLLSFLLLKKLLPPDLAAVSFEATKNRLIQELSSNPL